MLLFCKESRCAIVLVQALTTKPWRCTPSERGKHKKFLFSIYDFLRYILKNERPIPSIGDTHESTSMVLKLSLDNNLSTVYVSIMKF